MATMTVSAFSPAFTQASYVSSPLGSSSRGAASRAMPRQSLFPSSKPLRPFPTASASLQQRPHKESPNGKKPTKLIEPPKNQKCTFVLNLTQAEFSRQD